MYAYVCMTAATRYCNFKRTAPQVCYNGHGIQSGSLKMRMMLRQRCRATSRVLKSGNRAKETEGPDLSAQTCIFSPASVIPMKSDENAMPDTELSLPLCLPIKEMSPNCETCTP